MASIVAEYQGHGAVCLPSKETRGKHSYGAVGQVDVGIEDEDVLLKGESYSWQDKISYLGIPYA